jgi:hypothetical protein
MAADLYFAAGRTWLSLYEVRAGAIPGGGGTQVRAIKGAVGAGLGVDLRAGLEQERRFVGLVYHPPAEVVDRAGRSRQERRMTMRGSIACQTRRSCCTATYTGSLPSGTLNADGRPSSEPIRKT